MNTTPDPQPTVIDQFEQQHPEAMAEARAEVRDGARREQCTCGQTACASELCDCNAAPCPVDHAADERRDALRDRVDAAIRPTMLLGLDGAVLHDAPGAERIGEWVDWISDTVAAEVHTQAAEVRAAALTEGADVAENLAEHYRLGGDGDMEDGAREVVALLRAAAKADDHRAAARPDDTTGA